MQFLSLPAVSFQVQLIPNNNKQTSKKKKKNPKFNKGDKGENKLKKNNDQGHALLLSFGRCIVVHGSRAGIAGCLFGCGCVCFYGWGWGWGEKKTVAYVIWIKLCILPPNSIPCYLPRTISRKQVTFHIIQHGIKQFARKRS